MGIIDYTKKTLLYFGFVVFSFWSFTVCKKLQSEDPPANNAAVAVDKKHPPEILDSARYDSFQLYLAHNRPNDKWPVKSIYPLPGAILPFRRIVAYYGNYYSAEMGILGKLPPDEMLDQLQREVRLWEKADTCIPVLPALEYIAVTAQSNPGKDGKYRSRMPAAQIEKTLQLANKINAIVFLDIQVGWSDLQQEIPLLASWLRQPNVHLAIDPEYSMKTRQRPSSAVGSFNAGDINYAAAFLAKIVTENHIPPKILVVHRFTRAMVTGYKDIVPLPQVQIVMNMDGFGFPAKKIDTYKTCIEAEPVQFTGFKLFYKNDTLIPKYRKMMQPDEILRLYPRPIYIQYQ